MGLIERGYHVTVLTGKPNYPSGKYFEGYSWSKLNFETWNGISIYRSNHILRGNGNGIMLFLNYFSFVLFSIFRFFSIKSKFDKIFIFAPSPITVAIPGILASKIYNAKSILWVHDLWPESIKIAGGVNNKLVIKVIDIMTRWIYKKVDKILVQSEAFKIYINKQVSDKKKYPTILTMLKHFTESKCQIQSILKLYQRALRYYLLAILGKLKVFQLFCLLLRF